jgi:hypothetical protein
MEENVDAVRQRGRVGRRQAQPGLGQVAGDGADLGEQVGLVAD